MMKIFAKQDKAWAANEIYKIIKKTGEFHSNITISIFHKVLNAFNVFFIEGED